MTENSGTNTLQQNPGKHPSIPLDGKFMANKVVSCRVEGSDGALLYNPDTNRSILINPSGLIMWRFLAEPRTIDDLATYLVKKYNDCPDKTAVREDIIQFLSDLTSEYIQEA